MWRREILTVLFCGGLPLLGFCPCGEWEIEGFSLFAGPDILDTLTSGRLLAVVSGRQSHGVFIGEHQIGYIRPVTDGAPVSRGMVLTRIALGTDGKHRAWGRLSRRRPRELR
jgi:hypothetical protein